MLSFHRFSVFKFFISISVMLLDFISPRLCSQESYFCENNYVSVYRLYNCIWRLGVVVVSAKKETACKYCLSCFFTSVCPSAGRRESCFCVANFSNVSISPSLRKYICRLLNQKMLKLS